MNKNAEHRLSLGGIAFGLAVAFVLVVLETAARIWMGEIFQLGLIPGTSVILAIALAVLALASAFFAIFVK